MIRLLDWLNTDMEQQQTIILIITRDEVRKRIFNRYTKYELQKSVSKSI